MKKLITFLFFAALFAVNAKATSTTFYVNIGLATGNNDGSNWANAFQTFSAATTAANNNAGVDNVYVKGSIPSQSSAWNMSVDNYYGSFEGWETSPSQRPMNDNDGNGIIDPWEFKYPTTFTSTNNATAINGSAAIFDGFTITHTGTVSGSTSMTTLISPSSQTVQNCVFYGCILTYSAYTNNNGGCLLKVLGTFQNNLIEKNNVTITYGSTTDIKIAPILDINFPSTGTISAKVIGCIFRNNRASITNSTLTAAAPANIRGMILNVTQTTMTSGSATVTFSDCIVHNNTANYTGNGSFLTATSAAIVSCLTFSGSNTTDAMMNCLFANNSTTNMANACYFVTSTGSGVYHKVYNNVFWNNSNSGTNKSIYSQSAQNASTVFDNNYLDLANSGTWGGTTWGTNNQTNLSTSNTGNNSPLFKNPPIKASANFIGSALATSDSTIIKQADWRTTANTSYLYHKGAATATTGITNDKSGISFYSSNPTVGAYEFTGNQTITFSPFNQSKTYGDATFTLAASGGPSGNAVTFSSSDPTMASVSSSTVTILKAGTCNILANQAAGGSFSAASEVPQQLTISAKALTITSPAVTDKVYDGTTTITITGTLSGIINSDDVSLVGTGNTLGVNVGTNKTVTAACTLAGTKASCYSVTQPTGLKATFTQKPLSIGSPSIASKVYDGSATSGTVTYGSLSGFVSPETITINTATGTYADANVGTAKAANIAYTLADGSNGGKATNYSLANGSATGNITAKPLTIGAASIASKVYDGSTTSGTVTTGSLSGFVSPETVTVNTATGTYADANVGTGKSANIVYTLGNGNSGGLASNYSLANGLATGDITALTSTLSGNLGAQTLLAGTDVTVAANTELTVDNSVNVHAISVAPQGRLTINNTKSLAVGNLTLQSSPSGTATFTDANAAGALTVTGTSTVEQYLGAARNWYISSPISNATAPSGYTYYKYHEAGDNVGYTAPATAYWENIGATPTLAAGVGYIANLASGTATYSLSGTLNTGTVALATLTRSGAVKPGFNLVGNPYPSFLDITSLQNNANLEPSYWVRSYNSIYVFDTYNIPGGVSTGNSGLTVSSFIAPMQAFWLRVKNGQSSASVSFSNSMRAHQDVSNNKFRVRESSALTQPLIRLQVSNETNSDEAVLYSNPNASNDFDIYDSQKMSNGSASIPEIYTVASTENLAINGLNSIPYDTEMILGFNTQTAGNFSLKASQISNFEVGTQVILKDYLNPANPIIADLTDGSSYSFSSDVTSNNTSRFTLIFHAPSVTTGINPTGQGNDAWISVSGGKISVNGNLSSDARLEVFNALGQKIQSKNLNTFQTQTGTILPTGVYVICLTNAGRTITKRILVD